jgi:hypothetical protein
MLNFGKSRELTFKIDQTEPKIMPFIVTSLNAKLPQLEVTTL